MNDGKVRRKVRHLQATLLQVPTWIHPGIAQGLVFMAPVATVQMLNLWETSGISDCWACCTEKSPGMHVFLMKSGQSYVQSGGNTSI